jgi:hypothetical protein
MNTEPTVEECLGKLREMFPKSRGSVKVTSRTSGHFGVFDFDYDPRLDIHLNKTTVEIWLMDVKPANSELGIKMRAPTLSEAMAEVRQWHKENKQ